MKYDKTIQDIQKENVLLKAEVQRNHKLLTEQENERITLNNEKQKLLMDIQAFKNQEVSKISIFLSKNLMFRVF